MKSFLPMRRAAISAFIGSAWLLGQPAAALAQSDPAFTYGKAEDAKDPKKATWKASAQAGLLLATGNANSLTFSAGGSASRVDLKNKIALDVEGRFGQTTAYMAAPGLIANPVSGNLMLRGPADLVSTTAVSTQYWGVKLRYDRFFSKNNLGYILGQAMGDEPAGKRVFGGGQIGYSRQLYKSDRNELLAELGYDFSFVVFAKDDAVPHEIFIHSLRAFLGYNLTLSKDTALNTGLEGLFNLNTFNSPNDQAESVSRGVFEDTRINFKTALTTTIYKKLSFRFSFKLRFDNVPAPRPAPAGTEFVGQFAPLAEKLDTLSEAALVVNFL